MYERLNNMTLVGLVKRMTKKYGIEKADNIVAGMMLIHKDYVSLRQAIIKYLQANKE